MFLYENHICIINIYYDHYKVLYVLVVRTSAEFVSCTIDQPGHVQLEAPAEHGGHEPGAQERLVPAHHGYDRWQYKTGQRHENKVVSAKWRDQRL